MDNGPEFIANLAMQWREANGIDFKYIEPGKPTQNAYIERFNRSFRGGVLDFYLFDSLDDVRGAIERWVYNYNHYRPHDALGGLSPIMNKAKMTSSMGLRSASPLLHSAPLKNTKHKS
jgi:putative transposase